MLPINTIKQIFNVREHKVHFLHDDDEIQEIILSNNEIYFDLSSDTDGTFKYIYVDDTDNECNCTDEQLIKLLQSGIIVIRYEDTMDRKNLDYSNVIHWIVNKYIIECNIVYEDVETKIKLGRDKIRIRTAYIKPREAAEIIYGLCNLYNINGILHKC